MTESVRRAPRRGDREFHILKANAAADLLHRALKEKRITQDDVNYISRYVHELQISNNISKARSFKIVSVLVSWLRIMPSFAEVDIDDLYAAIEYLRESGTCGDAYSQNTQRDYIMFIKRFFKWLIENKYSSIPLEKITKIKAPAADMMTKTAGDLLTEMEVLAMINACQNSRDRALVSTLYEGAFRIMELATLQWSQVKFDEFGAVINVDLKTERPRYIRLISAVPFLASWRKDYPYTPEGDALVFITAKHHPLQYEGVSVQLKKIARRAGITKRMSAHLFRHTRITILHRQGCSEAVLKMMAWGHQGTRMMAAYSHLTGADIDAEVFRMNGIKSPKNAEASQMSPIQCAHCNAINEPASTFCGTCGLPLSEQEKRSMKQIVTEIERNPLYIALMDEMKKKVSEMIIV